MLVEKFLASSLFPKDVLDKTMHEMFLKSEPAGRSRILFDHLSEAVSDDPDYELWSPHFQWDDVFFEIPGLYISSKGRVYDSNRGQFRKLTVNKDTGYNEYSYKVDKETKVIRVDRAVGSIFVPSFLPVGLTQLAPLHKDYDLTNNEYSNLEWNLKF